MIIVAYLLIVVFFVMEGRLRQGQEAKSLQPGKFDQGSTRRIIYAYGVTFLLLLLAPLLNYFQVAVIPGLVVGSIGLIVIVMGLGLRYWASKTLGAFYTRTLLVKTEHHLVENGPYRLIRNPGYLGTILLFVGAGLAASNWLVAVIITITLLIGYVYRIRVEETMLQTEFGPEYRDYMARTWKLIPLVY